MSQARSQVQVSITAQLASGFGRAFSSADAKMRQFGKDAAGLSKTVGDIAAYRQQQNATRQVGMEWQASKSKITALKAEIAAAAAAQDKLSAEMVQANAAAKQAGAAYTEAKNKVTALQYAIEQTEKPTKAQRDALRAAKNEAKAAALAYKTAATNATTLGRSADQSKAKLAANTRELQRAETEAKRLGAAFTDARTKLGLMGQALQKSGVNLSKLSSEYKRLQGELTKTKSRYDQQEQSLLRQRAIVKGIGDAWNKTQAGIAGTVAAAAVLNAPARKALTYDEQLTYMADTAAAGKSVAEKQATKEKISDSIEQARVFSGGAKREDVGAALSTLIASGAFQGDEAMQRLPQISRAAFAGGASADDMAKTAVALKQFGEADIGGALDKMLRAGQLGNFEMKDMARWLPQQLALAKVAGYSGPQALDEILAFNQVSRGVAGTSDEAGNNVINLLQKFTSRELADTMAKQVAPEKGDPTNKGKKKGAGQEFDWGRYLVQRRGEGVSAVEAFGEVMQRQLKGNKEYQDLQKKLAATPADDPSRKQTLEAMTSIATGSELGQLIADRQALMAAIAAVNGREKMVELQAGIKNSAGAVEQSSSFVSGQTWAKAQATQGAIDRANESTFNSVSEPVSKMLDTINSATSEFPKLTTAVYGATLALTALSAASIFKNLPGLMRGGAAAAGAATGAATGAAGTAAAAGTAGLAAGGKLATAVKVAKAGAVVGALGYGIDAGFGVAGVGKGPVDEKQDDANWNKATFGEKVQSSIPRGIEKLGSLMFLDNLANEARAARIKEETEYLRKKEAAKPVSPVAVAAPPVNGGAPQQPAPQQPAPQQTATQQTTEAAKAAAAAAQEAAKAATIKPNVTITNQYTVTVTAPITATASDVAKEVDKAMRQTAKRTEAEQRASHYANPQY